jgi:hypothetical protein
MGEMSDGQQQNARFVGFETKHQSAKTSFVPLFVRLC